MNGKRLKPTETDNKTKKNYILNFKYYSSTHDNMIKTVRKL